MSLVSRLLKNSKLEHTVTLEDSIVFNEKDYVTTDVLMLNAALSGDLNGGLTPGITTIAGPSKHFKTMFALVMVKAYLDKYEDAVCLFYDSEFGAPQAYFEAFDIDPARVVHTPITNIEELKFDIMSQLEALEKNDRVVIMFDSLGNIASKKEVDDAINEKSVADMSRAKQIKSVFRMITPKLILKQLPMLVINHTYEEQGMFPKQIMSGGTGIQYSSNTTLFVSKAQDKDGTEIVGWKFTLTSEKSRFVKEKAKFPIMVSYEGGLDKYSGLLDVALELGYVVAPKQGWYSRPHIEGDKNRRAKETNTAEFWDPILEDTDFRQAVYNKYALGTIKMVSEDEQEDTDED